MKLSRFWFQYFNTLTCFCRSRERGEGGVNFHWFMTRAEVRGGARGGGGRFFIAGFEPLEHE